MDADDVAGGLEQSVTYLQTAVAAVLVALLLIGVVSLLIALVQGFMKEDPLAVVSVVVLFNTAIDLILYLFIVVELFRTVIAYVGAKNVVLAVVHAGLIAVVRQIITFKPSEKTPEEALFLAAVYGVLLLALLVGFLIVHRETEPDEET